MTIEEKREKIKEYCRAREECFGETTCPLFSAHVGRCYTDVSNERVVHNYELLFGPDETEKASEPTLIQIRPSDVVKSLYNDQKVYRLKLEDGTLADLEEKAVRVIKRDLEKEGYLYFTIVNS